MDCPDLGGGRGSYGECPVNGRDWMLRVHTARPTSITEGAATAPCEMLAKGKFPAA